MTVWIFGCLCIDIVSQSPEAARDPPRLWNLSVLGSLRMEVGRTMWPPERKVDGASREPVGAVFSPTYDLGWPECFEALQQSTQMPDTLPLGSRWMLVY